MLPKLDECAELKQRNSECNICIACDPLAHYTYREARKPTTNCQGLPFWPYTLQAKKPRCEGRHWLVDWLCGLTCRKFWLAPMRASWALGLSGWDWLPLTPWTSMGIWSATTCVAKETNEQELAFGQMALVQIWIMGLFRICTYFQVSKGKEICACYYWAPLDSKNGLKLQYICIFSAIRR